MDPHISFSWPLENDEIKTLLPLYADIVMAMNYYIKLILNF